MTNNDDEIINRLYQYTRDKDLVKVEVAKEELKVVFDSWRKDALARCAAVGQLKGDKKIADKLAAAIVEAAQEIGMITDKVRDFSGPQLLMILEIMKKDARRYQHIKSMSKLEHDGVYGSSRSADWILPHFDGWFHDLNFTVPRYDYRDNFDGAVDADIQEKKEAAAHKGSK